MVDPGVDEHTDAEQTAPSGRRPPGRRGRRGVWAAVAVFILVSGLALLVVPVSDEATMEVIGGNAPVNEGATDRLDVAGHNSPTVVVDPTDVSRVVVVNRVSTPRFCCAVHLSADGGSTWSASQLPVAEDDTVECFAPDAAFDSEGRLYVSYTSFADVDGEGLVPRSVWIARSDDGGQTFTDPVAVSGPLAFNVRLATHPTDPDRLYVAWVQTSGAAGFGFTEAGNPVVVARSDDGGETWADPVEVSPEGRPRVVAPVPFVDDEGRVAVAYLDVGDDRLDYHGAHEGQGGPAYRGEWELVVARSSDQGESWRSSVVDEVVPTERFLALFPPAPSLAVDGDRRYVVFHDGRAGDADVWLWRSTDGSWGEPRRVNDTPRGDGTSQHLPAVRTAPTGRVDVVYYDRRGDPDDVMTEVSAQSSFDGGETFTPRLTVSDRAFDSRIGFGAERDLADLGDRLGLASLRRGALAVWADSRAGEAVTDKQDLARAAIRIDDPPQWPWLARAGGAVLLLAGLVVLFVLIRNRGKSTLAGRRIHRLGDNAH